MLRKGALFGIVTTMFALEFLTFLQVQGESDLSIHIAYAQEISGRSDVGLSEVGGDGRPHFLFQILLNAIAAIGVTHTTAAVLLLGACYGGMALLIAREMDRRGIATTATRLFIVIPAMLIASHIFLFTFARHNTYYGYFVPTAYHSGTQQLNKLFALWIYFEYAYAFLDDREPSPRRVALIGGLCVASLLAKPSFLIAFLPAAGLVALRDLWDRRWRRFASYVAGIALPSAVVLLWQASVAYRGNSSAVAFAPFVTFDARSTVYKLPASLAFPLFIWVGALRLRIADARLRFIALYAAIALVITLCLVETDRIRLGNFAWTGQTAVFLAYVEGALFLLRRINERAWRTAAWAVFAVHVLCGVVWYGLVYFPQRDAWL